MFVWVESWNFQKGTLQAQPSQSELRRAQQSLQRSLQLEPNAGDAQVLLQRTVRLLALPVEGLDEVVAGAEGAESAGAEAADEADGAEAAEAAEGAEAAGVDGAEGMEHESAEGATDGEGAEGAEGAGRTEGAQAVGSEGEGARGSAPVLTREGTAFPEAADDRRRGRQLQRIWLGTRYGLRLCKLRQWWVFCWVEPTHGPNSQASCCSRKLEAH